MDDDSQQDLVAFLRDRAGDGFRVAIVFDERDYDFLHGQSAFEEHVAQADTRSPEQMHEDAVYRLKQVDTGSNLYDTEVYSEIQVTDSGTALYLFPDYTEGVFVWLSPETDVEARAITEEAIELLRT